MDSISQSAMYLLGDAYLKTGPEGQCKECLFYFCRWEQQQCAFSGKCRDLIMAKLSYELGFQDVALNELREIPVQDYPNSTYSNSERQGTFGQYDDGHK